MFNSNLKKDGFNFCTLISGNLLVFSDTGNQYQT